MSDLLGLICKTPPYHAEIGKICDDQVAIISESLSGVYALSIRLAQLEYNKRVEKKQTYWWDNLRVYLGIPLCNVRGGEAIEDIQPVPFGLLYTLSEITGCRLPIVVAHEWNVLDGIHLLHTDILEFAEYCLKQEDDLTQLSGLFEHYEQSEWGIESEELQYKITHLPHENLLIKKTLAVIEILHDRKAKQAIEVLKTVLEILSLLKHKELKFAEIEKYVVFDREIIPTGDKYLSETKDIDDFTIVDLFDFGTEIIEMSIFFDDDFEYFKENIEIFASNRENEWFEEKHMEILLRAIDNESTAH